MFSNPRVLLHHHAPTYSPQTIPLLLRQKPHAAPIRPPRSLLPARLEPPRQILALADIEHLQLRAPLHDGLDAHARDAHAAAHAQPPQLQQMQADGAQRRVRHRRAAERQLERLQLRAAEREDLRRRVRQRAAERLDIHGSASTLPPSGREDGR